MVLGDRDEMGSEETGGGLSQSPLADGADCADGEQGRAIPFITLTFDTDGSKPKFELAEQARAMLAEIEGPLSIISVVGMCAPLWRLHALRKCPVLFFFCRTKNITFSLSWP